MSPRPERFEDAATLADRIVEQTGGDISLGLPLGLGKAPAIANALYDRAAADRSIRLRILTALTLEAPSGSGDLERRFAEPLAERLFAGWPRFAYADALRGDGPPPNIEIDEFFLMAGAWTGVEAAQRAYTSVNYSRAEALLRARGVNVIAQAVAPSSDGKGLSLSCNPDVTLDLLDLTRRRGGPCLLVGQVNPALPFMAGEAALPEDAFDHLLTGAQAEFPLFAPPNRPVSSAEHAIGLRAAAMIPDGGTVQIGIGGVGDALGAALIMRHRAPVLFSETLGRLGGGPVPALRHDGPLKAGLYGVSEMFAPAFLELWDAGVLTRQAADGALLHAGFFLGPAAFYRRLHEMTADERALFQMRAISFTNTLREDAEVKRRDRVNARFVNNAMEASLLGDVASDTLADGRVVSGVGGQHDFAMQALDLPGARSIIALSATRIAKGRRVSRIVETCGRATLPRHLRDVIVTEYGVADLRGASDADCVAAMIDLADGAFQDDLRRAAAGAGKLDPAWRPERRNGPGEIEAALAPARGAGFCAPYPFETDFTQEERRLIPALTHLKALSGDRFRFALFLAAAAAEGAPGAAERAALERLGLGAPNGFRERLSRRAVLRALRRASGD